MNSESIKLKRVLAFLIDVFVYGMLWLFIMSVFIVLIKPDTMDESRRRWWVFALSLLAFVPMMLRDICTSIGKRILRLCVCTQNGEKVTWWKSVLRNIPMVCLFQIELILFLVSEKRLGDIMANTVVKLKSEGTTDENEH